MKTILTVTLFAAIGLASTTAAASEELAKAKNCLTCHGLERKIVGPSLKDIAAKRAGEKGAEAALAGKIKNGSKGEWGQVPMPANAVSEAEAGALAKWILGLK